MPVGLLNSYENSYGNFANGVTPGFDPVNPVMMDEVNVSANKPKVGFDVNDILGKAPGIITALGNLFPSTRSYPIGYDRQAELPAAGIRISNTWLYLGLGLVALIVLVMLLKKN